MCACACAKLIVRSKLNHKVSVHKTQLLNRQVSRRGIEPMSFCLPAYRLTARPNGLSIVVERASKVMISCQAQQQETGASVIGLGRQEESTWLSTWPRLSTVTSWGPLCQIQRINSWVIIFRFTFSFSVPDLPILKEVQSWAAAVYFLPPLLLLVFCCYYL